MDKVDKTIVIISIILGIVGVVGFSLFFFIIMGIYLNASSIEEILSVKVTFSSFLIITAALGLAIFLLSLILGIVSLRRDKFMKWAYFSLFLGLIIECGLSLFQTVIYGFDWQLKELFSSGNLFTFSSIWIGSLFDAFVVACLLISIVFFVHKRREEKG